MPLLFYRGFGAEFLAAKTVEPTLTSEQTNPINQAILQQTIHDTIPLSRQMGFIISSLSAQHIQVSAPLASNVNIHGTAFAGSIYSIATLTAWALAYYTLRSAGSDASLVLGEGHIKYKAPIADDLNCQTTLSAAERTEFLQRLKEKGRSRMILTVDINGAAFWEGKLSALTS